MCEGHGSSPGQCRRSAQQSLSWCPGSAQVAEHPWLATAQPLLSPLVVNDRVAEVTGARSSCISSRDCT